MTAALAYAMRQSIPAPVRAELARQLRRARAYGWDRYCPVCRSHVRQFLPFGEPPRQDAACPVCRALERHRFAWLYLKTYFRRAEGLSLSFLHFAPEREIARQLRRMSRLRYLSADLESPEAMMQMDITRIPLPEASIDVIYCSHVLNDVEDERAALAELNRVLRPGGFALIQLPVSTADRTVDFATRTAEGRMRRYGRDVCDRLAGTAFEVSVVMVSDIVPDAAAARRMGLAAADDIYVCRRPSL